MCLLPDPPLAPRHCHCHSYCSCCDYVNLVATQTRLISGQLLRTLDLSRFKILHHNSMKYSNGIQYTHTQREGEAERDICSQFDLLEVASIATSQAGRERERARRSRSWLQRALKCGCKCQLAELSSLSLSFTGENSVEIAENRCAF